MIKHIVVEDYEGIQARSSTIEPRHSDEVFGGQLYGVDLTSTKCTLQVLYRAFHDTNPLISVSDMRKNSL